MCAGCAYGRTGVNLAAMAWLTKGWMGSIEELFLVERWFGKGDPEDLTNRYDEAIAVLEEGNVEAWLEHAGSAGVGNESALHFQRDWLGEMTIPGVDSDTLAATFREGFVGALSAARDEQLPTSVVWVMLGDTFAINHVVGANAVTVVISVPVGTRGASAAE